MVVNFQSWTDPLIIIMALPGRALRHHLDALHHRHHAECAVADGRDHGHRRGHFEYHPAGDLCQRRALREGDKDARAAALSAGHTRLRPVLMTALAMIIGMLPMSLGFGEGGEQNAPLGRAVIGGLLVATFATLFFVPVVYSILRRKEFECDQDEKFEREAKGEPEHEHA